MPPPLPAPPRSLLDCCEGFDIMVALHLEAECLARLQCASQRDHQRITEPVVRWCADRRRTELVQGLVRGDLGLAETAEDAMTEVRWTLERLHLAEHPPRFPRLYFRFASDTLVPASVPRVQDVASILRRFPGLRVRIEGFGKPSAPPVLGRAVAQARATATRRMILQKLACDPGNRIKRCGTNLWRQEDPDEGVFEHGGYDEGFPGSVEFYEPRTVGERIQAVGLWGRYGQRNLNFEGDDEGEYRYDPEAKYQRVDFTVTGLDDVSA